MLRHIPSIELNHMTSYELELLGLDDEDVDVGLLQCEHHVHPEGKICITLILADMEFLPHVPFPLPVPKAIIHASQPWDDGGAQLYPKFYL